MCLSGSIKGPFEIYGHKFKVGISPEGCVFFSSHRVVQVYRLRVGELQLTNIVFVSIMDNDARKMKIRGKDLRKKVFPTFHKETQTRDNLSNLPK